MEAKAFVLHYSREHQCQLNFFCEYLDEIASKIGEGDDLKMGVFINESEFLII